MKISNELLAAYAEGNVSTETIHFSTLFQNSLREKIGRISDSTAITIQKRIVMAVLSLHNSLLCYLCSGKVLYVTT